MPGTVNGIGTWYYGKRDIHRLKGVCEFCNNMGELSSYDTTLYFVVVFVPVVPLTSYRVIEECPRCERHRVIKASKWQELKAKNIQEVIEPLEKNPRDREALLQGLGNAISFQDPALFEMLIPLTTPFENDADVQRQLAAGYSYFSRRTEATEAYKRSLLAEDKPETRQLLALNLLRLGEPDEAEPLIRHNIEEKKADQLYLHFLLIDTYQSQGKHQQALDMLDELEAAFPDLATDKEFKKLRADSNKHLATGKALRKATLVDSSRAGVEKGSNWSRWVPALVFIALLSGYLGRTIWLGMNSTVYLVNGSFKPYEVKVNDARYILNPGKPLAVAVSEGEVTVEAVDPKLEIPPVRCKVETPFFTRMFSRPLFVINPDEVAVLVIETNIYAKVPPVPPPPVYIKPQAFHELKEPDYLFTPFPESITVKGSQTVTKTRVGVDQPPSSEQLIKHLSSQNLSDASVTAIAKRLVQMDPTDMLLLLWLKTKLSPDEMLQFVMPRLDQQPILVDWHRTYQDLSLAKDKQAELEADYKKRLAQAADKDKQNARYLLGRITDEPQGFELMRAAAEGNDGSFHAMYAVGNHALIAGQFDEARRWADKMAERDNRNIITQKLMADVLMAQKKYRDLEQFLQTHPRNQDSVFAVLINRFTLAAMLGDKVAIDDLKQQLLAMVRREAPQQVDKFEAMLTTEEATGRGDTKAYLNAMRSEDAASNIALAILRNNLSVAEQAYSKVKGPNAHAVLEACLIYLLAKQQKNDTLAEKYWQLIRNDTITTARSAKAFHKMLEGKEPFTFEAARDAYGTPDDKRALLLVLADRFPKDAPALRTLAAKLNFQRDAYALAVQKFLREGEKKE